MGRRLPALPLREEGLLSPNVEEFLATVEEFLAIGYTHPPRRPKKLSRYLQKQIDVLCRESHLFLWSLI
uniref:Uncharacterized protein n=1 Tax=Triticum urartu TaxID=4572 RepID=A0A8R7TRV2_TRIUA